MWCSNQHYNKSRKIQICNEISLELLSGWGKDTATLRFDLNTTCKLNKNAHLVQLYPLTLFLIVNYCIYCYGRNILIFSFKLRGFFQSIFYDLKES